MKALILLATLVVLAGCPVANPAGSDSPQPATLEIVLLEPKYGQDARTVFSVWVDGVALATDVVVYGGPIGSGSTALEVETLQGETHEVDVEAVRYYSLDPTPYDAQSWHDLVTLTSSVETVEYSLGL